MKREYQNAVFFKKEDKKYYFIGIGFIFLLCGITTHLLGSLEYLYLGDQDEVTWFYHEMMMCCVISSIAIVLIFFMVRKNRLNKRLAFAIDKSGQGIWLNSFVNLKMIFIPFSMLEIDIVHASIIFKYKHAFYCNSRGRMVVKKGKKEKISYQLINEDQFDKFVKIYNLMSDQDKKVDFDKAEINQHISKYSIKHLKGIGTLLSIIGIVMITYNLFPLALDSVQLNTNNVVKYQNLKLNHTYSTSKADFKVNKAYVARNEKNQKIVIFNMSFKEKSQDDTFNIFSNLYISSDKNILQEQGTGAKPPVRHSDMVMSNNHPTAIMNQLTNEQYCNKDLSASGGTGTYNVVFKLSDFKNKDYLVYTGDNFEVHPKSYEEKPTYILKFNPNRLEVLQ